MPPRLTALLVMVAVYGGLPSSSCNAQDAAPDPEAVRLLQDLEAFRLRVPPFRVRGVQSRPFLGITNEFLVEYDAGRYRIFSGPGRRSVSIFDGKQLLSYDGKASAMINSSSERLATCLAFDPRAIGISTGCYSDLTLDVNLALHPEPDIALTKKREGEISNDTLVVEFTDQFSQRIRIVAQRESPHRVYRYSKTVPRQDGTGVFCTYVTESEFWPDDPTTWIPKRLNMYTVMENPTPQKTAEEIIEFDRATAVDGFDPQNWTVAGMNLPWGQPLVDLRIKQRVGYWNGQGLVQQTPRPESEWRVTPRNSSWIPWLIAFNLLVLIAFTSAIFWHRRKHDIPR